MSSSIESIGSSIYAGLAEVGFPLSVVAAVATTFLCGSVIAIGMKIKSGANPILVIPDKNHLLETPEQQGNALIGTGIFLIVISWLWAWLAYKYQSMAALSSIGALITVISSFHMRRTCPC